MIPDDLSEVDGSRLLPHQVRKNARLLSQFCSESGLDTYDINYTTVSTQFDYRKSLRGYKTVPLIWVFELGYRDSANGNALTTAAHAIPNESLAFARSFFSYKFNFSGAANGTRKYYFYYFILRVNHGVDRFFDTL